MQNILIQIIQIRGLQKFAIFGTSHLNSKQNI